jgi:hypothetical protein
MNVSNILLTEDFRAMHKAYFKNLMESPNTGAGAFHH